MTALARIALAPFLQPRAKEDPARVALGTMNFGKRTPPDQSARILARAIERGVTHYDTANAYNDGESERITGKALAKVRERCIVASKVGLARTDGRVEGLSRHAIARAIDGTLSRLGTDYVDLYFVHAPDPATELSETLDAIASLIANGKIRAWGVSNFASWQVLEVFRHCDARTMPRPAVAQQLYNLLVRQLDIEYFAFARRYPIHTQTYNPLAGGLLAGVDAGGDAPTKGSRFDGNSMYRRRYWTPRMRELAASLAMIARDEGLTLLELSYAWLARQDGVDSVVLGPATLEHLDAALDGSEKLVSIDARARIDACHREYLGTDARYAR